MPNRRGASTNWPSLPYDSDAIGNSVSQYLISQGPSASVRNAREQLIQRIERLIRNNLSNYGAAMSVESFGGTAYGVDSGSSDLDLVIIDEDRQLGFPPRESTSLSRLPKCYDMRWLANLLRRSGFTNIVAIPSASVPIVKFYDPMTSISIDINCNAQLGRFNTWLMQEYCELYPSLRPMIYFIKKWAVYRQINDPSGQGPTGERSLSSYCYALMIVSYLQMRRVLPNLQRDSAVQYADASEFWTTQGQSRIRCDTRIGAAPSFRAVDLSLGDALYGWFQYFGYQYNYGSDVLSPHQGGVLTYRSLVNSARNSRISRIGPQAEDLKQTLLMVQDPFILSKNVSGSCDDNVIDDFQEHCKFTAECMEDGHLAKTLLTNF